MKTFAIQYGFAEGPKVSEKLVSLLTMQGWQESSVEKADIVIAHSGGCRVVTKSSAAKHILLINISPWPEVSTATALVKKLQRERASFRKLCWNCWYAVSNISYALSMRNNLYIPPSDQSIIIRNLEDTYMPLKRVQELQKNGYKVISMPGQHDDVWANPEKYVELINSLR